MKQSLLVLVLIISILIIANSKQKRSRTQRNKYLIEEGYCQNTRNCRVPEGYEVDHVVPLFAGGEDMPSNMQLLTKGQHKEKTKLDRKLYDW